jgi:hypothetical protein
MKYFNHLIAGTLALAFLSACGGGDSDGPHITTYTGNTSQATLSTDNASVFTKTTPEATSQKLASSEIPFASAFAGKTSSKLMDMLGKSGGSIQLAPVDGICTTGSVDANGNQTSATMTFRNCTIDSFVELNTTVTLNGTITMNAPNYPVSYSISITNFSVTFTDFNTTHTESIENMTVSCNNSSCTITSDFTGSDGRVYRIANYTVTGVYPNYTISGRIYHPTHGYVEISGNVTYGTCDTVERPTSGSMTITGSNGTATITLNDNDCHSFSIDINGTVTTSNW